MFDISCFEVNFAKNSIEILRRFNHVIVHDFWWQWMSKNHASLRQTCSPQFYRILYQYTSQKDMGSDTITSSINGYKGDSDSWDEFQMKFRSVGDDEEVFVVVSAVSTKLGQSDGLSICQNYDFLGLSSSYWLSDVGLTRGSFGRTSHMVGAALSAVPTVSSIIVVLASQCSTVVSR